MQITSISDTHGLHHQLQLPGGDLLIHAGDVCKRGTQQEAANFIDWFEKQPYAYKVFIAGNHDYTHIRNDGFDIGRAVAKERSDMIYLGQDVADVKYGKTRIRLFHGSKGPSYARSYKLQK